MSALRIFVFCLVLSLFYFIFVYGLSEKTYKFQIQQFIPRAFVLKRCNINYKLEGDLKIRTVNNSDHHMALENIRKENPDVMSGGYFSPTACNQSDTPRDSVAIIVPFRDRMEHLLIFLQHMHPILTRQKLEYKIYVINQEEGDPFNRGKLINIGYTEAMKERNWTCLIMHDVDYLPLNDKNLYVCGPQPRRLIVAGNKWSFGYAAPYRYFFGGVAAMIPKQFETVNGFYNDYFGWGAEDDDLAMRIGNKNMRIDILDEKEGMKIGKYQMLHHVPAKPASDRLKKLEKAIPNMSSNGLNSLEYKVISRTNEMLYTNITVDVMYKKPLAL